MRRKETRGRPTAVETIERAIKTGSTVPLVSFPIPPTLKARIKGLSGMQILRIAEPYAALYLLDSLILKRFKPSWARIDVAKYVLDQVNGKARARLEISGTDGSPASWQALMLLFTQTETVEELARHGQPLPEIPSTGEEPKDIKVKQASGESGATLQDSALDTEDTGQDPPPTTTNTALLVV